MIRACTSNHALSYSFSELMTGYLINLKLRHSAFQQQQKFLASEGIELHFVKVNLIS